ncbi:Uncharacterised protein [Vibrio cholerae]|nr:Uncharacterised protein [Vibrio cholerae]
MVANPDRTFLTSSAISGFTLISPGDNPSGRFTESNNPLISFFLGSSKPSSIMIERHTLSNVEQADVTALSGSRKALSRALSRSLDTVSIFKTSALVESVANTEALTPVSILAKISNSFAFSCGSSGL